MNKPLVLNQEVRTAKDKEGQTFQYDVYYVEINGIKLALKPSDATAKLLLKNHYQNSSAN